MGKRALRTDSSVQSNSWCTLVKTSEKSRQQPSCNRSAEHGLLSSTAHICLRIHSNHFTCTWIHEHKSWGDLSSLSACCFVSFFAVLFYFSVSHFLEEQKHPFLLMPYRFHWACYLVITLPVPRVAVSCIPSGQFFPYNPPRCSSFLAKLLSPSLSSWNPFTQLLLFPAHPSFLSEGSCSS